MRSARSSLRPFALGTAAALISAALSGCHLFHRGHAEAAVKPHAAPAAQVAPMLPVDLTKVQPNEAGLVPILEYHDLVKSLKTTGYQYPASAFRKDIQWLYDHNYRPVSLHDYALGKIDCPAGMSPVILTFDDALRGQFNYTADGKVDPDCAVGILDAFHARHPDWPLKGTFFVLTDLGTDARGRKLPPPFYQAQYAQGKMDYLIKAGYEIGNHTVKHAPGMRRWPDARVEAELAGAVANIHHYEPGYVVDTLALPFGVFPKNKKLVVSGASGGVSYHNICALAAGADPAASPMGRDFFNKGFNPYHIPRIIPGAGRDTIHYWLELLEKQKALKYVSDGDPNTYTVNAIAKGQINLAKLKNNRFHLRTYNGTQVVASN